MVEQMKAFGLFGATIEPAYGGLGLTAATYARIVALISEVWIALPEGTQTPVLSYPTLRITRLRGAAYSDGIQTVTEHGAAIRVYSAAKTVTDCFKFRNKIGLDVALEALKEAWRSRKVTMAELHHFARINRVERVMQPYLEAVTQ